MYTTKRTAVSQPNMTQELRLFQMNTPSEFKRLQLLRDKLNTNQPAEKRFTVPKVGELLTMEILAVNKMVERDYPNYIR